MRHAMRDAARHVATNARRAVWSISATCTFTLGTPNILPFNQFSLTLHRL